MNQHIEFYGFGLIFGSGDKWFDRRGSRGASLQTPRAGRRGAGGLRFTHSQPGSRPGALAPRGAKVRRVHRDPGVPRALGFPFDGEDLQLVARGGAGLRTSTGRRSGSRPRRHATVIVREGGRPSNPGAEFSRQVPPLQGRGYWVPHLREA